MNAIIKNKIQEINTLCKKYSVQSIYAFGSVCTDEFTLSSDIDLLITFQNLPIDIYTENYFALHTQLEQLFNRSIDLLTEKSLKNPFFIEEINQTKQLIYET